MKKLTIAIPTKCSINAVTFLSIQKIIKGVLDNYEIVFEILPGKSNIDQARSMLITKWYDDSVDDDLFMFLDSDQSFEVMDIKKLLDLIVLKKADVSIGIYSNRLDKPTSFPVDREKFFTGQEDLILYAGTGVMMITRNILKKIEKYLANEFKMDSPRFWIDVNHRNVIPFFTQRFVDTELGDLNKRDWLGEDFAFCWLVRKVGGKIRGFMSPTIGHEVTTVKYFYPKEISNLKTWTDLDIVYYLGVSIPWSPLDIETKGLGGSETAVVYLSTLWKKMGYNVTVYTNTNDINYKGVNFIHISKFNINDKFSNIILWRNSGLKILSHVNSKNIFVDFHDIRSHIYSEFKPYINKISKIFVKSNYHKNIFLHLFNNDNLLNDKIIIIENGLDFEIIDKIKNSNNITRNMKKLIYASDYRRGLIEMLKYGYDYIKERIPDIELHVFYGDHLIKDEKLKKQIYDLIEDKGIINHGFINQSDLFKEKLSSGIHYYMSNFDEVDCISIKESLYCGCIPVVSNINVFNERKKYLNIIDGDPNEESTQLDAAKLICDIIMNNNIPQIEKYPFKSWEDIALEWINIIYSKNIDVNIIKQNYDIIEYKFNETINNQNLSIIKKIFEKSINNITYNSNNSQNINNKIYKLCSFYFNFNINSLKNNIIITDKNFNMNEIDYNFNTLSNGIYFYDNFILIKNKLLLNNFDRCYLNIIDNFNFNNLKNNFSNSLYLLDCIILLSDNEDNDNFFNPIVNNIRKYVSNDSIKKFTKFDKNTIEYILKTNLIKYNDNYIDLINDFIVYTSIINNKYGNRIMIIRNNKDNDRYNKFFCDCDFNLFWKNISYIIDNQSKFIGINLFTKNNSITNDFLNNNIYYVNLDNIGLLLNIIKDSSYSISKKDFNFYLGKIKQINLDLE